MNHTLKTMSRSAPPFGGRGSAPPEASYVVGAKVADRIDLDRIEIGRRLGEVTLIEDSARTHSRAYLFEDGRITAVGPQAMILVAAIVALLVRAKIAPNASMENVETRSALIRGRGARANMG